jgi:hypothetical protein
MIEETELKVIFVLVLLSPLLIFLTRWGILFAKRYFLFLRLNEFSKNKGFTLIWHRKLWDSLFSANEGFDFTLDTGAVRYRVFLLSSHHRFREHSFVSATGMDVYRDFRIRRIRRVNFLGSVRRQSIPLGFAAKTVPLDLTVKAAEGEVKILLFYPVAKVVTKQVHGKKQYLDSGSELFENTVLFSLSAFLKQVSGEQNYIRTSKPWEYE